MFLIMLRFSARTCVPLFVLFALTVFAPLFGEPLTEEQKIQALLKAVETSGIQFVRNGTAYGGKEARSHLELKLSRAGGRIKTAEHFIEYLATKSSMTGALYYVKYPDGKQVPAAEWLRAVLKKIEQ